MGFTHEGAEGSDAVQGIVSNHMSELSGKIKLSAPPSISAGLLGPFITSF
ncbi:MAG: hypothetical protein JKY60_12990 [Kordiimonadaceae bacterium]|nr:hypothetical protein [Kordiimonadaceae bacterium]